ncbi:MAG: sulfate ABC transporter substrate-binding protein [Thermoguttaceae bacterium]
MHREKTCRCFLLVIGCFAFFGFCVPGSKLQAQQESQISGTTVELLNVSYDPTRELYRDFNEAFAKEWLNKTGQIVKVKQSHGGSGKQARAVIEGQPADVVTLALAYDVDAIHKHGNLLPENWQSRLPYNSSPYTSTIVFLVRKGNPKWIKDWNDLIKPGVEVITPNPKTSGGARWNYLAAWGYVLKRELGDFAKLKDPKAAAEVAKAQAKAQQFVKELFAHVPVLNTGARDATMTFVQREMGDVLLAWENEAFLSIKESGPDKFDIVSPPLSILAEPTVSVVDAVADKHGTRKVAEAYLQYLYSPVGQTISAKHYYRPRNVKGVPEAVLKQFPKVELFTIEEVFDGWQKAQARHFDDGGVFDQIYKP